MTKLAAFLDRLQAEAPPRAQIVHRGNSLSAGSRIRRIQACRDSDDSGKKAVVVLPDVRYL